MDARGSIPNVPFGESMDPLGVLPKFLPLVFLFVQSSRHDGGNL